MRKQVTLAVVTLATAILLWLLTGPGTANADTTNPYASPDPGGNETVDVPVPPPGGQYFGFDEEHWEASPWNLTADQVAGLGQEAGANAQRFEVDWWAVEPTADTWDESAWSHYQRMYDALVARGMKPIVTVGFAPPWARDRGVPRLCGLGRGCEYPPAESMLSCCWDRFIAQVAKRFPKAAIEVWNEPNMVNFWKPYPDPARYAELVASTYAAAKQVNPNVTILAGALAPAQAPVYDSMGNETVIPMKTFIKQAYAAQPSIKGHMDGLSFHTTFQQLDYGQDTLFAKAFADARSATSAAGDSGLPLWITETGLTTTGSDPFTDTQQADGLLRQYRREMQMPDVRAMIIYTLLPNPDVAPSDARYGNGVLGSPSPLTPKLAYCAFANRAGTPTSATSCPAGIFEPGTTWVSGGGGSGSGGGTIDSTLCADKIAALKARRAHIRSRMAVYRPYAQQGYEPAINAMHRLRHRLHRVKRRLNRVESRCAS